MRSTSRSCGESSAAMAFSNDCRRKLISTYSSGASSVHCSLSDRSRLLSPALSPPAPDPLYAELPELNAGSSSDNSDSVARKAVRRRLSETPISAAMASSVGIGSDDSTYCLTSALYEFYRSNFVRIFSNTSLYKINEPTEQIC